MSSTLQPETIQKLGSAAYPAFAMLAGMQLDLFTPLSTGPMAAEHLATQLGVDPTRLAPLLYALVSAGLLTFEAGRFANTPEAQAFLVKGQPTYMGGRHAFYTARYQELQHTAASIRTGRPQAKLDFASLTPEAMEAYLKGLHPGSKATGRRAEKASSQRASPQPEAPALLRPTWAGEIGSDLPGLWSISICPRESCTTAP